jgi:hypothetical protein
MTRFHIKRIPNGCGLGLVIVGTPWGTPRHDSGIDVHIRVLLGPWVLLIDPPDPEIPRRRDYLDEAGILQGA